MLFTEFHKRLLKRFLFLLIPYSLLRIGFYFYHFSIYKQFAREEIFISFLHGIRFDIAAICLLNSIIILFSLVPSKNSKFIKFERLIFTIINTVGFMMALDDYELFLFMGKRLSFDLFAVTGDIIEQLPQLIMYYWYFPLFAIALGIGVYFFDKQFFATKEGTLNKKNQIAGGFLVVVLSFIGVRGGLQHKSINVQTAFVQGKNELGHLVLNTPYHFLRTLKNQRIKKLAYFGNEEEAKKIILNSRKFGRGFPSPKKYNVVLLILESFSLEYFEKGYMPFLSELSKESLLLKKHLANGRRSIEVLPSVLCGLPSLIEEPISKSIFSGNRFNCMPKILKAEGYTNYFFHGGAKGTMGFESYTLSNGFDRYFSKDDYPSTDHFDGTWGIYDGPYLQFVQKELSQMPKPFLAGIFTLSSHQPYAVPKEMEGKFPKGTLEIHESIGYTDFAVKEFFQSAKKESWFKDTVFIITADHTQKLESKKFENLVGHYRVPLMIYAPSLKLPALAKITQHSDIPMTILDLVGVEAEMPLTGTSVFAQDEGQAVNYADGSTYFLVRGDSVFTMDKSGRTQSFPYSWDSGDQGAPVASENVLLKANLQYFINGLINNNLSR